MTKSTCSLCRSLRLPSIGARLRRASPMADGLDPIAVRQAVMSLQGGDFACIRAVVAAKGDVKPLEVPAKAIAKCDRGDPDPVPEGHREGRGHQGPAGGLVRPGRLPEDRHGRWTEAATKLAADAKAGDADAVAADAKLMGEQCGACHKTYRAK